MIRVSVRVVQCIWTSTINLYHGLNLTVRNRYNHNNYSSTDLSGELDNNDTYEIGTYWNFKITDKFSYTFEPHY
ncbi:hypothetical protein GA343_18035, partial [Escherichia coli]|nr:hypothetical protein [Escherichia coli]